MPKIFLYGPEYQDQNANAQSANLLIESRDKNNSQIQYRPNMSFGKRILSKSACFFIALGNHLYQSTDSQTGHDKPVNMEESEA